MEEIKIENYSFSYQNTNREVLKSVNLTVNSGEFLVLCGESGCGKTTLLRSIKKELSPRGRKSGEIYLFEKKISELDERESVAKIGFVAQNPQYQAVTNTVESEIVFGLTNIALNDREIRMRTAEMASYFGISQIIDKKISELSGGQLQLVNLASVVAMHPEILLLDEPTAQLDPMAAESFLRTIEKLNRDFGITVVLSEQRLESVFPYADRVAVMDEGEIVDCDKVEEIGKKLSNNLEFIKKSMPVPMRVYSEVKNDLPCPVTIRDGGKWLGNLLGNSPEYKKVIEQPPIFSNEYAVEVKNLFFKYPQSETYVLTGLTCKIPKGVVYSIMGSNAAGKTTLLKLISGLFESKRGKIKIFGKDIGKYKKSELYNGTLTLLTQKTQTMFSCSTVYEDLMLSMENRKLTKEQKKEKIERVSKLTEISQLLNMHPYDLSGGEMQRAALAMVILTDAKIFLLDEVTKGMDNLFKAQLAQIFSALKSQGKTIIMVSHDTEFCGENSDICMMLSMGNAVAQGGKREFFSNNYFFTTSANKMSRRVFLDAITAKEVADLCKKNLKS